MKRFCLAVLLLALPSVARAQQPVTITNVQAVDFTHDAALSLGTTSGPVGMCRTSAARPTAATGDTRAFAVWCNLYGATHTVATDNAGNDLTFVSRDYYTSAATTNSRTVKASAGNIRLIHGTNTTGTTYYLRLYNSTTAPTCSSATNFIETIPLPANGSNGRVVPYSDAYTTGIAYCITGGGGSTDNTNAATGLYVTIHYN